MFFVVKHNYNGRAGPVALGSSGTALSTKPGKALVTEKKMGYLPKVIKDYRRVLEKKDVDVIFIATPEHWHAPMTIMAMQAGKHVYVEKPCSHNPHENELLVTAQKKYGLKVQMGNQQRSAITSINAIQDIRNGIIGEVFKGEAYYSNNRGHR